MITVKDIPADAIALPVGRLVLGKLLIRWLETDSTVTCWKGVLNTGLRLIAGRSLVHNKEVEFLVDDTEDLGKICLEIKAADLCSEEETVATPGRVAEVLQIEPLALLTIIEMARRTAVLPVRVLEQLLLATFTQIMDEYVKTSIGLLQDLISLLVCHMDNSYASVTRKRIKGLPFGLTSDNSPSPSEMLRRERFSWMRESSMT